MQVGIGGTYEIYIFHVFKAKEITCYQVVSHMTKQRVVCDTWNQREISVVRYLANVLKSCANATHSWV